MDNFKCRAWYPSVNQFLHFEKPINIFDGEDRYGIFIPVIERRMYISGSCEPEFYFDKKDLHGNRLCEGDIIVINQEYEDEGVPSILAFRAVIKFRDGAFWFDGINYNITDCRWFMYNESEIEIKGNIHETPELLEAK